MKASSIVGKGSLVSLRYGERDWRFITNLYSPVGIPSSILGTRYDSCTCVTWIFMSSGRARRPSASIWSIISCFMSSNFSDWTIFLQGKDGGSVFPNTSLASRFPSIPLYFPGFERKTSAYFWLISLNICRSWGWRTLSGSNTILYISQTGTEGVGLGYNDWLALIR